MVLFIYLDRYMLRSKDRLAERLAGSAGQLFIIFTLLLVSLLVAGHPVSWSWLAAWLGVALLAISILVTANKYVAGWRHQEPKRLLAGDCRLADEFARQLQQPYLQKPRAIAIEWLNTENVAGQVEEVVLFDPKLCATEQRQLLKAIQQLNLSLCCPALDAPLRKASRFYAWQKRLFDILSASLLLFACAPLLLIVALIIYGQDRGPVIFRQKRLGLDGTCITILKFRSMQVIAGNDTQAPQATQNDPRVTTFGRWIRYWGIDELPQLINVLVGDMSMVGPRPHAVAHDLQFGACIDSYYQRLQTRPGITGLAQIRGLRGEIQEVADMQKRVDADMEYISRHSLAFDIFILAATPLVFLRRFTYRFVNEQGKKTELVDALRSDSNTCATENSSSPTSNIEPT